MCDKNIKNEYPEGKTLFYVKDFGAIGDGVHDDAVAIRSCCDAAAKHGSPAAIIFEEGKVYYANSFENKFPWTTPWSQKTLLYFENTKDITVEGNGSRLELGLTASGIFAHGCENMVYQNFTIDHKVPTFIAGLVKSINEEEKYLNVKTKLSMDDYLENGKLERNGIYFALPNLRDTVSRNFLTITKIISEGDCNYKIYPYDYDLTLRLINKYGIDKEWMWPCGAAGHGGGLPCGMKYCGDTSFINVDFQSGGYFMFYFQCNYGDIKFINSNVEPNPKYGTNYLTTGRDIFHCADNRGAFIWENCNIWWAGDDFMNICDTTSYVESIDGNAIKLCSREFRTPVHYKPGDVLEAYDHVTGKYYGKATVVKAENGINYLEAPFEGMEYNKDLRVNCPNLAAPGSKIKNCKIVGTGRFKGDIEITDTYFDVQVLWLMHECDFEGPIPKNLVFRNCVFDNGDIEIAAYDRSVPGSDFKEIGKLIGVSFYDCEFNRINFVEKNDAKGKYYNCKYNDCIHTGECRFEKKLDF